MKIHEFQSCQQRNKLNMPPPDGMWKNVDRLLLLGNIWCILCTSAMEKTWRVIYAALERFKLFCSDVFAFKLRCTKCVIFVIRNGDTSIYRRENILIAKSRPQAFFLHEYTKMYFVVGDLIQGRRGKYTKKNFTCHVFKKGSQNL